MKPKDNLRAQVDASLLFTINNVHSILHPRSVKCVEQEQEDNLVVVLCNATLPGS